MFNDNKSLAHTRWIYEMKDVKIIEAHEIPDHIQLLVRIPSKNSISSFMSYLKGRSVALIHEKHANLKYKHGNKSFCSKG